MTPAGPDGSENAVAGIEVTVIVPVWNGAKDVARCLAALKAQTVSSDRYDVVVVDNGSDDGTYEFLRGERGFTVLQELKPGSYAARNNALRSVSSRYVAFTDADCVPDPGWLAVALRAAEQNPDAGVFSGPIRLFREEPSIDRLWQSYEELFSFPQDVKLGSCATANWLSPTPVMQALGGFNEDLKSGGDGEMAKRIAASGHPIVYVEDMVVNHPVRATFDDLARKRRRLSGGLWDRSKAKRRLPDLVGRLALNTARRYKRLAVSPDLTLSDKARLALLVSRLSSVALAEFIRLDRGRPSQRA